MPFVRSSQIAWPERSASYSSTRFGITSAKRAALVVEARRDVLGEAAGLEVARVHARRR